MSQVLRAKVYVFSADSALSKNGKPYHFQPVEVDQRPVAASYRDRHFISSPAEALPPGEYEATVILNNGPTGCQPRFRDFTALAAAK
jgi:hypothetical protein